MTGPVTAVTRKTIIPLLCDFFQSGQAFYLFSSPLPSPCSCLFQLFMNFCQLSSLSPPLKVMQLISTLNIYSESQVLSQALTTNMLSDKVWRKETVKPKTMSEINKKIPPGQNGAVTGQTLSTQRASR